MIPTELQLADTIEEKCHWNFMRKQHSSTRKCNEFNMLPNYMYNNYLLISLQTWEERRRLSMITTAMLMVTIKLTTITDRPIPNCQQFSINFYKILLRLEMYRTQNLYIETLLLEYVCTYSYTETYIHTNLCIEAHTYIHMLKHLCARQILQT